MKTIMNRNVSAEEAVEILRRRLTPTEAGHMDRVSDDKRLLARFAAIAAPRDTFPDEDAFVEHVRAALRKVFS
jgi:hypothetical protein